MLVFEEIQKRHKELVRLHRTRLERARHEAETAQRRFLLVNPENRLVADSLEHKWNDNLRAVAELEEKYEYVLAENKHDLTSEEVRHIQKLVEDFPRIWNNPRTSAKERKRMIRLLIEDVTLLKTDVIHVKIRFKGGDIREVCVPIPPVCWKKHQTSEEVIEQIQRMAHTKTDSAIAEELNRQGCRTGTSKSFNRLIVYKLRQSHDIPGPYVHLREQGFLTAEELAIMIDVCPSTVKDWGRAGILKTHRYNDKGMVLFEDPGENVPVKWATQRGLTIWGSKLEFVIESTEEVQYEA